MAVTSRLCNAGDGTQGFVCARQGLDPVSHILSLILAPGRVRQEDLEFEASHAYSEAMFQKQKQTPQILLQSLFQCSKYTDHAPRFSWSMLTHALPCCTLPQCPQHCPRTHASLFGAKPHRLQAVNQTAVGAGAFLGLFAEVRSCYVTLPVLTSW